MAKCFDAANLTVYLFIYLFLFLFFFCCCCNRFADNLTELSAVSNTLQICTVTSSKKLLHLFSAAIISKLVLSKVSLHHLIFNCIRIKVLNLKVKTELYNKNVYQAFTKGICNMVIQSCSTEYFSVSVCVYPSFSVH